MTARKDVFKVAPHVAWRRVESEVVVLDLDSSVYYSFNDTGAELWARLAEGGTLEEAVEAVAEQFDAEPETIGKDAADFLKALRAEKFLEPA
jgi:hypothetical protein